MSITPSGITLKGKIDDLINIINVITDDLNNIKIVINDETTEFTVYEKRHQAIHQKCFFTVSDIYTIGAEATLKMAGLTGSKYIHMTPPIITPNNGNVKIKAYRSISNISSGSNLSVRNNFVGYENDILTSWVSMKQGVTFDGENDLNRFYTDFIGGAKNTGQTGREVLEWILSPNSYYSLTIENAGNQENTFGFFLQWYETMNGL